jgi:UDP-glucuronate 4-epimerase
MLGECTVRTWCERAAVPLLVLRFTSLYGPAEPLPKAGTDFLNTATEGAQIRIRGDSSSLRGYLYLDDAADVVVAALESKEVGVFNAAHPERVSLKDIPKTAVRIAGRGSLAHEHPDTPRRDRVMDVGRMLNVLCFQPKVGLADGLRECHFE